MSPQRYKKIKYTTFFVISRFYLPFALPETSNCRRNKHKIHRQIADIE
jgi:hypothetical protein